MIKKGLILSVITLLASCSHTYYRGKLILEIDPQRGFVVRASALRTLDRWVRCGYGSSLPDELTINEGDLNPKGRSPGNTIRAQAEVGGSLITLDAPSFVKTDLDDIIGHEILHVIGFSHAAPEDYCNFNRILNSCGFDITRSGPLDCRDPENLRVEPNSGVSWGVP